MEKVSEKPLNSTVKKLGAVSFFADIASEMLYPITPIFLTTVLGASMASLGVIEGCAEAIASLLKTYSGSWSDKIEKRKPFVVMGYFLAALSKPLIGIATHWTDVLFARGIDRAGKGIRSAPRDALIAESVPSNLRGAAFGWHRGMDTLGAAIGPLLTISFLSSAGENFRALYLWALIPGMLSVFISFTIKEKKAIESTSKAENKKAWKFSEFSSDFKKYLVAWTLFSFTNSSDVFLLLRAKSSGATTTTVVLLYCVYNLIYAFSSPYLGKISDSIPRKFLMIFGLFTYACVYLGFAFADQNWHFWILFMIYGLYMGSTDGVGKALAIDYSPKHLKATSLGLLGTLSGLATILASSTAGYLWDHMGYRWTFYFGATGATLAILFLFTLQKKPTSYLSDTDNSKV